MSQHDFNIANQTAPNFRADLNLALTALASLSSGGTAPSTTYANMLWYDTSANILKMRNEANSGWIDLGYLDQGVGAFRILDDTQVTNTSGTQTGLLGDQATATWEAGTGTTESLVSPAKVKAAIDANSTVATKISAPTAGITQFPIGSYTIWYSGGFATPASLFDTLDASSTSFTVMDTSGGGYTQKTINYGTWMYMGRIYNVTGALVCRIS